MSPLQKETLEEFMKVTGRKTFQQYSELLGIEKTRIFRIFNGAEMKLKEFEKFQEVLGQRENKVSWKEVLSDAQLTRECSRDTQKRDYSVLLNRNERLRAILELAKVA